MTDLAIATPTTTRKPEFSFVLEVPAAHPEVAQRHFAAKLTVETDPADVNADLSRGNTDFVVVDARATAAWTRCRVPGAISLPYRSINEESAAVLPRDRMVVVYCWGPACNAGTKAAVRLANLGFQVKEMIGGIEYWRHEGHPVEGTEPETAPMYG